MCSTIENVAQCQILLYSKFPWATIMRIPHLDSFTIYSTNEFEIRTEHSPTFINLFMLSFWCVISRHRAGKWNSLIMVVCNKCDLDLNSLENYWPWKSLSLRRRRTPQLKCNFIDTAYAAVPQRLMLKWLCFWVERERKKMNFGTHIWRQLRIAYSLNTHELRKCVLFHCLLCYVKCVHCAYA